MTACSLSTSHKEEARKKIINTDALEKDTQRDSYSIKKLTHWKNAIRKITKDQHAASYRILEERNNELEERIEQLQIAIVTRKYCDSAK